MTTKACSFRQVLVTAILLASSLIVSGQTDTPVKAGASSAELKKLQATYDDKLAKLNQAAENSLSKLNDQYIKSLTALEKAFQEKGKLDQLLATKKERERFQAEPKVDDNALSVDIQELAAVQLGYRKELHALPLKKARDIVTLAEQYKKSLSDLQQKLTKAGDIEAAIVVKNERDAVEDKTEVTAARFVMAETEAKNPPAEQKPAEAAKEIEKKPAPPAPAKKKYAGSAENYIKKRFDDFCKLILAQEMDKATEFVDPAYVKEKGAAAVRGQLFWVMPFLRTVDQNPTVKFDSGRVEVDKDEEHATLIPRLFANNRWTDLQANSWVQVDGDWFLDATPRAPPPAITTTHDADDGTDEKDRKPKPAIPPPHAVPRHRTIPKGSH